MYVHHEMKTYTVQYISKTKTHSVHDGDEDLQCMSGEKKTYSVLKETKTLQCVSNRGRLTVDITEIWKLTMYLKEIETNNDFKRHGD